jgi:low temperature requirement protein LtrA
MIRLLVSLFIQLVASAVGLIVAAVILDDMTLSGTAFFIAVAIFTATTAIIHPFIMKTAVRQAQALLGASALISTFIGLVVTTFLSDGLSISGADTWLFATLIVWAAALGAALLLPVILVKLGVQSARSNRSNR